MAVRLYARVMERAGEVCAYVPMAGAVTTAQRVCHVQQLVLASTFRSSKDSFVCKIALRSVALRRQRCFFSLVGAPKGGRKDARWLGRGG